MAFSFASLLRSGEPTPGDPVDPRTRPAILILRTVIFGLFVVVLCAGRSGATAVLISLAVTGVSAVVGFLFGLPRTIGGEGAPPPPPPPAAAGAPTAGATQRPRNASLEQIADWLTKLMLGAGLTQLVAIKQGILTLSKIIAGCYSPFFVAPAAQEALVFGLGVIGFFATTGFLGGYLSTRLILARLLTAEELDIDALQAAREAGRQQGKKEGAEAGRDQIERDVNQHKIEVQKTTIATAVAANPKAQADLAAAESWQPTTAETVSDDPQKNRFGGKAEVNDRRLAAVVEALNKEDGELFQVVLKVDSSPTAPTPLVSPVKFFLHYSFPQKTIVVPATMGNATLELVAWGAFTVGAITDDGKTLLELDLANLATAPQKFRDR